MTKNYLPTRKWFVAQVTLLGTLATTYVVSGTWDQEETLALIGFVVQAVSTYLIPNSPSNTNSP